MTDHLVSTPAKDTQCPRCQAPLLEALDEGLRARVDTQPLDPGDEIGVLMAGLWTYTLTANGHLVHRDAGRIESGSPRGTIHAQHRCRGFIQETIFDLKGHK